MYKDVLRSIEGIGLFPCISLIVFITLFVFMLVYVMKKSRKHWQEAAEIPLQDEIITTARKV